MSGLSILTKTVLAVVTMFSTLFSSMFGFAEEPIWPGTELVNRKPLVIYTSDKTKYDLYVDTEVGDDSFDGSSSVVNTNQNYLGKGPLKTIAAAKEKLKALKGVDGIENYKINVWIDGGTYVLDSALAFTADDLPNVTYRCASTFNLPHITAGKPITGFTAEVVNGVTMWTKALNPADVNITNLASGTTALKTARYPAEGYFTVASVNDADATVGSASVFSHFSAFYGAPADIKGFRNPSDVSVRMLHYWKDELTPLVSADPSTGRVVLKNPTAMVVAPDDRYFFENVFEALDAPGEWYIDRASAKLYYVPQKGEDIATTTLVGSSLDTLVTIDGADGINFKGLIFENTAWGYPADYLSTQAAYNVPACFDVRNSKGSSFSYCEFRNIGNTCINLGDNVQDAVITVCLFDKIGGCAVRVGGQNLAADDARVTRNITVFDNYISHYGTKFFNAIGVFVTYARNVTIERNEVCFGTYSGMSIGWSWGYGYTVTDYIKIKDNAIHDIGQGVLSDLGGIYTLGIQENSEITGNRIYNVKSGIQGAGSTPGECAWGIYLDEGTTGMLVEKNLVYDCSGASFHVHYGKDNVIRNNIFAFSDMGQIRLSRKEDHTSFELYKNIIVGDGEAMYSGISRKGGGFNDNSNLYWDYTAGKITMSSKSSLGSLSICDRLYRVGMKSSGYYRNGVFADPWFRDTANRDFSLATNSPAIAMGFECWNTLLAGTLTDFTPYI